MTTAADVLKLIKEKEVKFVDLRFTDTKGKEQHVTVPTRMVDDAFFEDGKGFDGSSIAGWKGIQESDMILMPDPETAVIDPFYEETTLDLRCDVIEPSNMQGYERDPRSLAKRAEAYIKSTGIADSALFGPRERILHLRQHAPRQFDPGRVLRSRFRAGRLELRPQPGRRQPRSPSGRQGRVFPGASGRRLPGHPHRDVPGDGGARPQGRGASPRGRDRGPGRDQRRSEHAHQEGRRGADPQVRDSQRRGELRQDGDVHAEAPGRGQRQRHARQPVADARAARTSSAATSTADCPRSRSSTSAGSSSTRRRSTRSATRAPTATSDWYPASKRR